MSKEEESNITKCINILIFIFMFWLIFSKDKYQGQTAKEWFNYYDHAEGELIQTQQELEYLKYCIEDNPYNAEGKCL